MEGCKRILYNFQIFFFLTISAVYGKDVNPTTALPGMTMFPLVLVGLFLELVSSYNLVMLIFPLVE